MPTNPISAFGVSPPTRGYPSNAITLPPGQDYHIPSGTWNIGSLGGNIVFQEKDQVSLTWKTIGGFQDALRYLTSDGSNYRVANQTGCVIGAYLTNAGTGYTSAPTVTAAAGSPTFVAVTNAANHMVNTSVTVNSSGTNYTYAPVVMFDAPPAGGIQATGYATLSAGTITITVTNQGGGYTFTPNVYLINDSRDSTGAGAAATATLTGAGTIAGLLVTNFGTWVSYVPAISFTGGGGTGAAATALLNYVVSAYTVTSAGSGYAGNVLITGLMPPVTGSNTQTAVQTYLVQQRQLWIQAALSGTTITATGQTVFAGGNFTGVPTGFVLAGPFGSSPSAAQVTFTGSGVTDTVYILPV